MYHTFIQWQLWQIDASVIHWGVVFSSLSEDGICWSCQGRLIDEIRIDDYFDCVWLELTYLILSGSVCIITDYIRLLQFCTEIMSSGSKMMVDKVLLKEFADDESLDKLQIEVCWVFNLVSFRSLYCDQLTIIQSRSWCMRCNA